MIAHARALNPSIATVVRSHNEEEAALLAQEQAGRIFLGEAELAAGMSRHLLDLLAGGDRHDGAGPPHAPASHPIG